MYYRALSRTLLGVIGGASVGLAMIAVIGNDSVLLVAILVTPMIVGSAILMAIIIAELIGCATTRWTSSGLGVVATVLAFAAGVWPLYFVEGDLSLGATLLISTVALPLAIAGAVIHGLAAEEASNGDASARGSDRLFLRRQN